MTMSMPDSGSSEESVTSYLDASLKAPLLVSQTTIVGMVFSQISLSNKLRALVLTNSNSSKSNPNDVMRISVGTNNRLVMILILSAVTLIVFSTCLYILEIYNLSSELGLSFLDTYSILNNTSTGTVWLLRMATSIPILIFSIIYYITIRKGSYSKKVVKIKTRSINYVILSVILICGSINLISNSMVSHNAATEFLPWLAISVDWFHVMAVSIWVGGLFYLSLILLYAIRISSKDMENRVTNTSEEGEQIVIRNSFLLAVMLPYFSVIAIICLGIIGVSGLYMAWLQLQSVGSLFGSLYGNILILKLCVIIPMIVLGAYHQIKLHYVVVRIAQRGDKGKEQSEISSDTKRRRDYKDSYTQRRDRYDPFRRFSKTIKIESLIGIAVLTISAFLTITSPPSMVQSGSQMQMQSPELGNSSYVEEGSEIVPKITNEFTIAAIILAALVLIVSFYYFRKNKQELKATINLLKTDIDKKDID